MYRYIDEVNELLANLKSTYLLTEATCAFYFSRVAKFFETYMSRPENVNKPQNTITYYDLNAYLAELKCSSAEKVNCYQSLKRYFDFSYLSNKTSEIMSHVEKPIHVSPPPQYIEDDHYKKLSDFVTDQTKSVDDRLLIGLFLFTGLSRNYIAQLTYSQFEYKQGLYYLKLWKDEKKCSKEYSIPLKAQIQLLVDTQVQCARKNGQLFSKVFNIDSNYMSTRVSELTNEIVKKKYRPTEFSNTFIKKCLEHGNRVWEVSMLTLESMTSIEKHVLEIDDDERVMRQSAIINSF